MRIIRLLLGTLTLLASLIGPSMGSAWAQGEEEEPMRTVQGVFVKYDAKKQTLSLMGKDKKLIVVKLALNASAPKKTQIFLNGKPADIAKLPKGSALTIKGIPARTEFLVARKIEAVGATSAPKIPKLPGSGQ